MVAINEEKIQRCSRLQFRYGGSLISGESDPPHNPIGHASHIALRDESVETNAQAVAKKRVDSEENGLGVHRHPEGACRHTLINPDLGKSPTPGRMARQTL